MRALSLAVLAASLGCAPPQDEEDERLLEYPPLQSCSQAHEGDISIVSWNISAARRAPLEEVRDALAELDADVVLLQENDVGVDRTGNVHQPAQLAEWLGYDFAFAEALEWDGGVFGLAVLSRLPFARVRRRSLFATEAFEPRIALDVEVCRGSSALRLVNVHADFKEVANAENLADLAGQLGRPNGPFIVAGDFNAQPDAQSIVDFADETGLVDSLLARDPGPTHRNKRVDFAFVSPQTEQQILQAVRVPNDASDHRALELWIR